MLTTPGPPQPERDACGCALLLLCLATTATMFSNIRSFAMGVKLGVQRRSVETRLKFFKRSESTSAASPTYTAKKETLISPTMILVGSIPIFSFALGTWQVQRLKWKVALIDELEEKLQREPISLPKRIKCGLLYLHLHIHGISHVLFYLAASLVALPDFAFRKVLLKGHLDNAHSMLLGPRVRDGTVGYHLVMPLIRADGSTVLVDRGFVSKEMANDAKRRQEDGEVEILGLLRTSHVRNSFTPDNNPQKGEWYWTDVDAMAEYAGGERSGVQPVFVEEIFGAH